MAKSETETAVPVAPQSAHSSPALEKSARRSVRLPYIFATSPDKPFDIAPTIAQAKASGYYGDDKFFAVEVGDIEGRKVMVWSYPDAPLEGEFTGKTMWRDGKTPHYFLLVRVGDTLLAEPFPLVLVVRRGHEQGDYIALLKHLNAVGVPEAHGEYPLFKPEPGEEDAWIGAAGSLDALPD